VMIRRIKFLGIPVRDQDRALRFYTEKLGFRILTDQQISETQRWIELSIRERKQALCCTRRGTRDRREIRLCFLAMTRPRREAKIETCALPGIWMTLVAR